MNNQEKNIESHIVLGYKCNQYCKHCVVQIKRNAAQNDKLDDLSFNEAIETIKNAINNGVTKIIFTGGEPTLRDDLPELTSFCLIHGCAVQIQTNGSIPNSIIKICHLNSKLTNKLEFMIPLHSACADKHDYICGNIGAFNKTLESFEFLKNNNFKVIGKIVLTKYTDDLNSICDIYEKYNADSIIIAYPHCVSFPVDLIYNVDLNMEDTARIFNTFYKHKHKIPIILQAFPRCFVGDNPLAIIQEEQNEFLSLQIIEQQLHQNSGKLWHKYRKMDKRKFSHCSNCKYNNDCEGIWKEYLKVYGK